MDQQKTPWDHDKVWNAIHILSDIRAAYSIFDPEERARYNALSTGIEALREVIGVNGKGEEQIQHQ